VSVEGDYSGRTRARYCGGFICPYTRFAPNGLVGWIGAVEKTRTSTGCPTATSTLRVYQFRHDRSGSLRREGPLPNPGRGNSKSPVPKQARKHPGMAPPDALWTMPEWRISGGLTDYPAAMAAMEERVAAIRAGTAPELVWLLEHPSLYTAGTSAKPADLLLPDALPVYETGRGGQITYHGPGQRIAYAMVDLRARGGDLRRFVHDLEEWIIRGLACFGVQGERRADRIGIWVVSGGREDKIAALGVRVRHGVTFHGIAVNRNPDLSHFAGIVPCGIRETAAQPFGVTSLAALGKDVSQEALDIALKDSFSEVFRRR